MPHKGDKGGLSVILGLGPPEGNKGDNGPEEGDLEEAKMEAFKDLGRALKEGDAEAGLPALVALMDMLSFDPELEEEEGESEHGSAHGEE